MGFSVFAGKPYKSRMASAALPENPGLSLSLAVNGDPPLQSTLAPPRLFLWIVWTSLIIHYYVFRDAHVCNDAIEEIPFVVVAF